MGRFSINVRMNYERLIYFLRAAGVRQPGGARARGRYQRSGSFFNSTIWRSSTRR
jgi:hypothetical protein